MAVGSFRKPIGASREKICEGTKKVFCQEERALVVIGWDGTGDERRTFYLLRHAKKMGPCVSYY